MSDKGSNTSDSGFEPSGYGKDGVPLFPGDIVEFLGNEYVVTGGSRDGDTLYLVCNGQPAVMSAHFLSWVTPG